MKLPCSIIVIFLAGCIGDAAVPIISSTDIPNTRFQISLDGPDREGGYGYVVSSNDTWTGRSLGPFKPEETAPAKLEDLGNGVFRIQWSSGSATAYAMIDAKNELIVKDSNPANGKNQPFLKR